MIPWRRLLPPAVAFALALVGAFLAGRASVRLDDEQLSNRVAVWTALRALGQRENDSLRSELAAARALVDTARAEAARLRASAARARAAADSAREVASAFRMALAQARTAPESLFACLGEVEAQRTRCGHLEAANDSLTRAGRADADAQAGLQRQIDGLSAGRARDSSRLVEAGGLIRDLRRNARGCRIPLIGLPCPEALGVYEWEEPAFLAGVTMPLKVGPVRANVGVVKRF